MVLYELVFATHNPNKAAEIQEILGDSFLIKTLDDLGVHDDIPETATTLEGNALLKSQYVIDRFNCNVFSDDTGLEIAALNGEPGVYSARYAGDDKNNQNNIDLVLKKLENKSDRSARFRTAISLFWDGKPFLFEGIVTGTILTERRGTGGFGYDPVFLPDGFDQSFAEMSSQQKNKISHRGRAIDKMVSFLKQF
ncbi:MAG: RdgB/HAM1 family non-canonical purine NTP pyrophosphatase [Bacteroidia bacterium]|nr:RdgB/HAM1 family non-canonical purine NTP pyrophosphatase [Bacteroidia bacterium]